MGSGRGGGAGLAVKEKKGVQPGPTADLCDRVVRHLLEFLSGQGRLRGGRRCGGGGDGGGGVVVVVVEEEEMLLSVVEQLGEKPDAD